MLPGSKLDAASFNSAEQTCTCTTGCMVSVTAAAALCASAQSLPLSDGAAWSLMCVPPLLGWTVAGCMESAAWGPVAVSVSVTSSRREISWLAMFV